MSENNLKSGENTKSHEHKSSKIVADFLKKTNLHKKDFAQMIGVTLSYVYNLIDESVPFSTRAITLERIAVVMGINPEEFIEYKIPPEPASYSENLIILKELIKRNNFSNLDFLFQIERKKRLPAVDILRGARAIPIDYFELKQIGKILNMDKVQFFNLWKDRMVEYLTEGGFNIEKNKNLLNAMFECAFKSG